MSRIEKILLENGPMLSGKIAEIYQKKYGATNEAARKAISRACSPIQKIKVFPFESNQVFCYLEKQYNSKQYFDSLYKALKEKSATISVILTALENNMGYISKELLPIYSASPISNTKGHRLFSRNLKDLIDKKIIYEYDENYWKLSECFVDSGNILCSKSNEKIGKIILRDFISWAKKLNIIAYDSVKMLPDVAEFSHFQWVATCPSYMQPIYDIKEKAVGFVVVDVVYGKQVDIDDVRFFIDKVKVIRCYRNVNNFLPILLIESATLEAFNMLKNEKIFIGVINNIFDEQYTHILSDIYHVFNNATRIMMKEPSKIDFIIENIAKSEGRFNNIMGDLFEYMVGSFYYEKGTSYFEMNKFIPNERGTKNEMDIFLCKDNKAIVVECKAMKSPLSFKYVKKWISEILPVFRRWIQEKYPKRQCEFQIWSLGGFDEEARRYLIEHKKSAKKYSLEFFDKEKMIHLAKQYNDSNFVKKIQNHFYEY